LAQAELRGIARVLIFEHPELKPTIVDVDAEGTGSAPALVGTGLPAVGFGHVAGVESRSEDPYLDLTGL
jgi:hypothetical protein